MEENSIFNDDKENQSILSSTPNKSRNYSMLSSQEKLLLSSWGLPDTVQKNYERNGICSMFPWQAECLSIGR